MLAVPRPDSPRGFTLVEVLVVITIILVVSVLALGVYRGSTGRQVDAAARLVQAELVGARDHAIRTGRPSGIRLVPDRETSTYRADGTPDPAGILAVNRVVPIAAAPDYRDGLISVYKDTSGGSSQYPGALRTVNGYPGVPCLVLEQSVTDSAGAPNAPTNWFWNIRVGDKIQINNAGPWYTIVGPMVIPPAGATIGGTFYGNAEMFVNNGPPGAALPVLTGAVPCEYLLLVNGRDDDGNGWIDEGWDGVDNDGNGKIDDGPEWESERWVSP